jgi:putative oxidoreductase
MPMVEVLLVATIAIELVGGLMLVVGWKARWAALAIFLFIIPATLIFHAFWAVPQEQVMMQTIQFQKNLAIMGGMLFVAFMGPGRLSLDKA